MQASREDDLDTVMSLMTDDVVFLTPGNPPMGRNNFAAGSKAMAGKIRIEGQPKILEITVTGDLAVCWTGLLAATGLMAAVQWYRTPLPNLNVIVPGRLYRSGYPRYRDLALAQPRLKLRTVVNLDGGNEASDGKGYQVVKGSD